MYCRSCGTALPENALFFCLECREARDDLSHGLFTARDGA